MAMLRPGEPENLLWRYGKDLGCVEIAARLGVSLRTGKRKLAVARQRLQAAMKIVEKSWHDLVGSNVYISVKTMVQGPGPDRNHPPDGRSQPLPQPGSRRAVRRWIGGVAAWMVLVAVSITLGLRSWSCHASGLLDAKDFRAYTTNWPNSGVMTFIHHLPRTNAPVSYRYVWAEDQWMIVVESGDQPPGVRLDVRRNPDALGVDSKGPWRIRSTSEAGDPSLTRFSMGSAEEQERRMWGLRERILFIRTFGLVGVEPEDLLWHGPKAEFQSRQIPGFAVISTNSMGHIVKMEAYYGVGTESERRLRLTYAYGDPSSLPGFPVELQLTLLAPVQQVGARYVISSFEPREVRPHELDPEFLLGTLDAPRYHVVAQTTFRETDSGLRELGSVPPRYELRRVLIIIVLLCLLLAPWLWLMISRYCRR